MLNEDRVKEITVLIKQRMNGAVVESMRESGIVYKVSYGVTIPELQQIAQPFKGNHELAIQLFDQDIRECKIIASMIDEPKLVTGPQIDEWSEDFTNHEIVEQVCNNLFWKSDYALSRSYEWCLEEDELMKKAGLIIVGRRASDNTIKDSVFEPYINIVENLAETEDELVSNSAINALRQIAKRSESLNKKVTEAAERMGESNFGIANWIGNQLLFELTEE